ncbi:MAG: site-specific DNA-methyltransferase [bacterium]|nr:site-specific DNA-methyltransferase [bacterium]
MKKGPVTEERKASKELSEQEIRRHFSNPELGKNKHRIVIGDSRRMKSVQDNSVHLIVTSPPYFNAKEYAFWNTLEDYLEDMRKTLVECYRVLKPGRKFCLNISDLPEKGGSGVRWIPLGSKLLQVAFDSGFELVDRIIWYKTPVKGFQYGSLPYPPSPLICDSMEYIYVLRKPNGSKPDYSHLTKLQKEASRLTREEYAEYTKQIWTMRRVRFQENQGGHVAPFPEELPLRCIKLYSFVGETVLDPFGGSGTTTKMAILNKRDSVLYEIKKEYLEHIRDKTHYGKPSGMLFDDPFINAEIELIYE